MTFRWVLGSDLDIVAQKHLLAARHLPDGRVSLQAGCAYDRAAQRSRDTDLVGARGHYCGDD